jgi:glutathione S-transferase
MITLYHSLHSTCSQKVRLCLAEKGIPWAGKHLNLRAFDQLRPEFLAINPAGLVPVLVDGDLVLGESRVINEYLEDAYPGGLSLLPGDAAARARMRIWTRFADVVAGEAVKLPSFVKNIVPAMQSMAPGEAAAMIARIPDPHIRSRWQQAASGGFSAGDLAPSLAQLAEMLERMDAALVQGPWLAGEQLSLADLDIAPFVQRLVRIDLFPAVQARPRVLDWYERISARPAYAAAMPPAGSEGGQALLRNGEPPRS